MSARGHAKKGIAESAGPAPTSPPAKVFGSHFFPEMRLICNLFDASGKGSYRVDQAGDVFTE